MRTLIAHCRQSGRVVFEVNQLFDTVEGGEMSPQIIELEIAVAVEAFELASACGGVLALRIQPVIAHQGRRRRP